MNSDNTWNEWSKYVLKELERLNDNYENVNKNVSEIKVEIGQLQVKAGFWGAIGGGIPLIILIIMKLLGMKQ